MMSVESTLSTLRRTGFALVVSALAILFLATPSGRDFEPPLEELRGLREVLDEYRGHCANLADGVYSRQAREITSLNATADAPLPFSASFGLAGVVSCNLPTPDDALEAYRRFFLDPAGVLVLSVAASEVYAVLRRFSLLQQDDIVLDSVYVLIGTERLSSSMPYSVRSSTPETPSSYRWSIPASCGRPTRCRPSLALRAAR